MNKIWDFYYVTEGELIRENETIKFNNGYYLLLFNKIQIITSIFQTKSYAFKIFAINNEEHIGVFFKMFKFLFGIAINKKENKK